jgi:hypothetical protein
MNKEYGREGIKKDNDMKSMDEMWNIKWIK